MGRPQPEIDRLLEEGLARYGRGDLDGALAAWRQVLVLDPLEEQALGYVDYVRMNYELLTGQAGPSVAAGAAGGPGEEPFPLADDEPTYLISATQDELAAGSAEPRYADAPDGWAIEEEVPGSERLPSGSLTLDLDPDEPELELELTVALPGKAGVDPAGISFDDATKEYANAGRRSEPVIDDGTSQEFRLEVTPTPGFEPEATPGFGAAGLERTAIRQRDLGFVQAVAEPAAPRAPGPPRATASVPDLRVPGAPGVPGVPGAPGGPSGSTPALPLQPLGPAPGEASLEPAESPFDLPPDVDPPTIERSPLGPLTADLIASLGARDRSPTQRSVPAGPPRAATPPPPPPAAPPPPGARSAAQGVPPVRALTPIPAPSGRLPTSPPVLGDPSGRGGPYDFDVPTERKGGRAPAAPAPDGSRADMEPGPPGAPPAGLDLNPLITAPTRDLGLRPVSLMARGEPEDDPTMQVDVTLPRAATPPAAASLGELVLPFDPIDARAAQILDAIDRRSPAPPDEPREDRTRRRIAALFEHAIEWSRAGEIDRAVIAVDLALSEDPNSALAQKLIHRNRDTIMHVFQSFLGDLHRTPVLARPLHELASSPISPRAAFLLSRVDGLLSLDEILDVSGMPRMEAFRYLCQLYLRGILR